MTLPSVEEHETAEALLIALNDYVTEADALLDARNMIELSGLDAVVDVLCARVLKLSADQHAAYADRLEALGGRLNLLQKKMVATQESIKTELMQSSKRQLASRAYRKDPN